MSDASTDRPIDHCSDDACGPILRPADAEFIAAARTLVPTLIADVERRGAAINALHRPTNEEVESWADDENPEDHDRRFSECPAINGTGDCEGHTYTMQVCQECGYTHNGETPAYRPWPCATLVALCTDPDEARQ